MALDEPHQLQLLGHSTLKDASVTLDEADWRWLRERRVLVMGVSGPDYAPFDLTNNKNELEGITADYAALIADILNVAVDVQRFDTRDEVIEALKTGVVDFVGSANGYEAADPQLVLSRSYA
ncbi:transporter substrate-binding domain-containing protein, partial [Pseudomonas bubulae]